jgi:4a-hydroxytetrahydrobiopterin dehydratase
MTRLTDAQVRERLKSLPEWKLEDNAIRRSYSFADFIDAMHFVNEVAEIAEDVGHHPDIDIRYNRVTLGLTTHDAGGLTENDLKMAAQLDGELDKPASKLN